MKLALVNSHLCAEVPEEAYPVLTRHEWKISKRGYVYRQKVPSEGRGIVLLHRQLMWQELSTRPGYIVDHWNGDKLDNQWGNLKVKKQGKNILNNHNLRSDNVSGIAGVYWDARVKRWKAVCGRDYLGSFKTKEGAEEVRKKEVEARGGRHNAKKQNFAVRPAAETNFIGTDSGIEVPWE